ncbi:MAG: proline--tRNA ligase, partial [Clostridia bacterium]|nr:proline--tRNA ligase [Clostridia bacterium]
KENCFIKTMWCGDEACELKLKDEVGVTSRCMPFGAEPFDDVCPICGKKATKVIYWGKAY